MADLAVLSLLWTVFSLPVITAGASSAALMRCVINMQTGRGNWRARHFVGYFRSNLRNATPLWLLFLAAAAVLAADLFILSGSEGTAAGLQRISAIFGLILWMTGAVWAFALTSLFENSLVQTVKNAFLLGISCLPRTVLMSALWLAPAALFAFAPDIFARIAVLWPALFFGGTAWLCSRLMIGPLTPFLEEN